MNTVFYIAAAVAVVSSLMVITRLNAVHALLYLVVSFLSVAVVFFTLGAPFVAILEVIVYAGAIMVLFVFVVMMLNLGETAVEQERQWLRPATWGGPTILLLILLVEVIYMVSSGVGLPGVTRIVEARRVSMVLFGPYLLGVELASMLLLAGLVGAFHLGRRTGNTGG